jgi:hypothetical protein
MLKKIFLMAANIFFLVLAVDLANADDMQKYFGVLRTGVMAIGGANNPALSSLAQTLHGKKVVVTGSAHCKPGIEIPERCIITVATLEEAPVVK